MFTELTPAQYIMAQLGAELGFDKESWSVRLNEGIKAFIINVYCSFNIVFKAI